MTIELLSNTQANTELMEKFPSWVKEIDDTHKLILTDDMDSLFSCVLLQKQFNCGIEFFYDFKAMYSLQRNSCKMKREKLIGIDVALEGKNKVFDNHVVKINKNDKYNELSANLNIVEGISQSNYYEKYAGSTALTILSLYRMLDVNELTDEQLMYIACIDSWYLQFYKGYRAFYKYAELLDANVFVELFKRKSKKDFDDFKYNNYINGKIKVSNGKVVLSTKMINRVAELFPMLDFKLPDMKVHRCIRVNKPREINLSGTGSKNNIGANIFSFALTKKHTIKVTMR